MKKSKKLTARDVNIDEIAHLKHCLETLCFWLFQSQVFGEHDFQYFKNIVHNQTIDSAIKSARKSEG